MPYPSIRYFKTEFTPIERSSIPEVAGGFIPLDEYLPKPPHEGLDAPRPLRARNHPHQPTTIQGYTYDAAGNVLSDGLHSSCGTNAFSWNAESQMSCAAGTTYTYDGDGTRVEKSGGTLYWGAGPLAESDLSGNLISEYIFFNGQRIARRDIASGTVYYYLSDHLGSSNVVTDASGAIKNESDFYPYGGESQITDNLTNQKYKFTGKERDTESGNDYFGARYYASSMGRFLSPDWSAKVAPVPYAKLDNPQSLNLYSYVGNNPLSRADADGHFWQELKNWATGNGWQNNAQVATNNLKATVTTEVTQFDPKPNPVKQGYADCKSSMNNTAAGKAINFGSPLALLPGWNPQSNGTDAEWAEAIGAKGTALVGTGALSTPTELTSLSGETNVGSVLENGAGKVEGLAEPAMVVATAADVAASGSCFASAVINGVLSSGPSNTVNINGVTTTMPDENDPASYGAH